VELNVFCITEFGKGFIYKKRLYIKPQKNILKAFIKYKICSLYPLLITGEFIQNQIKNDDKLTLLNNAIDFVRNRNNINYLKNNNLYFTTIDYPFVKNDILTEYSINNKINIFHKDNEIEILFNKKNLILGI
jgi:hypothetical protein